MDSIKFSLFVGLLLCDVPWVRCEPTHNLTLRFSPQALTLTLGEPTNFSLISDGYTDTPVAFQFQQLTNDGIRVSPEESISFDGWCNQTYTMLVTSSQQGRFIVKPSLEPSNVVDDNRLFLLLKVAFYKPLIFASLLVGWAYTACWSLGYYPQIWLNHRRKSVEGLSFDFLYINIAGHLSYTIFNGLLYWSSFFQEEYFRRHPYGLNPVIGNDVGFAVHALFATTYTILQGRFFETGGNTVSLPAKSLILLYIVITIISAAMAAFRLVHWLDFIYVLSYIKLSTTMVKYFPQAFMNYRRKSTEGFAIVNRLLDLAGGLFSILQMVINAWNFNDWQSILGDPVKFGIGVFSILFDLVFAYQHYVLYRKPARVEPNQVRFLKGTLEYDATK